MLLKGINGKGTGITFSLNSRTACIACSKTFFFIQKYSTCVVIYYTLYPDGVHLNTQRILKACVYMYIFIRRTQRDLCVRINKHHIEDFARNENK